MKRLIACFLSKLVRFRKKQRGWICFLEQEEPSNLDDPISNGGGPENPSPRCVLGDKATCYGTNGGPEKGSKTVDANRTASLFRSPTIAKDATTKLSRISQCRLS